MTYFSKLETFADDNKNVVYDVLLIVSFIFKEFKNNNVFSNNVFFYLERQNELYNAKIIDVIEYIDNLESRVHNKS